MRRTSSSARTRFFGRTLHSLGRKLRDRWVEAALTTVVALSITAIGVFGRGALDWAQRRYADYQNISEREAIAIAREVLSARVRVALPFRTRGSPDQFILTGVADTDAAGVEGEVSSGENLQVYVLRGSANVYEAKKTGLEAGDLFFRRLGSALSKEYYHAVLGTVDVEGRGRKQVFAITRDGGSALYSVGISVFDPLTDSIYRFFGAAAYESSTLEPEFSENVRREPALRQWLGQTARSLMLVTEADGNGDSAQPRYNTAVRDWLRHQGVGFYQGALEGSDFPGMIPQYRRREICRIDDGRTIWVSYFRGAVFGFTKATGKHFVVYVPWNEDEFVPDMISGRDYLWLALVVDRGVLVLHKADRKLKVLRGAGVPDMGCGHRPCGGSEGWKFIIGEVGPVSAGLGLHSEGGAAESITLEGVDLRGEFVGASRCR